MGWAISRYRVLTCLAVAVAVLAMAPGAQADIIMIPALAFVPADTAVGDRNASRFGNLDDAEGKFYAAVLFPKTGWSVCELRLYVRDDDTGLDATARLVRKTWGAEKTFSPAVVMAEVMSTGYDPNMRSFSRRTPDITSPLIQSGWFFLVELELPADNFMQVLGVYIQHKETC